MFGVHYIKASPTTFVMHFKQGNIVREGPGLSFFYWAPSSTIVTVPISSTETPFIFTEITKDYQEVTIQGQLTYRVVDPKKLAAQLDFSLNPSGRYATDDPVKLPQRLTNATQTATRAEVQGRSLKTVIIEADRIAQQVRVLLPTVPAVQGLGVEITDLSILAIKPTPDTAKALEAETRELFLREADDAIYQRRNNAVEQERRIRESELNTEMAVQAKQREIDQNSLAGKVALEERRKELVALEAENGRTRADAQAYALEATLKPLTALDPKALQVLASQSIDPRLMVAMSFQEIAANAAKIGNLNISPELLESLLQQKQPPKK